MPRENEVTAKERLFCELYVSNGYKAVAAYLIAYPTAKETTAKTNAFQVLKRDRVKKYIHELEKDAFEANCINAERIANELADIAFADKNDEVYCTSFKLKAIELLQKQLGLQQTKIDAKVDKTVITVSIDEE